MAVASAQLFQKMRMEEPTEESIAHHRAVEASRKDRIFNPKERTIGVDRNALDNQVEEKARMRNLERKRDAYLDAVVVRDDYIAQKLSMKEAELRAQDGRDLVKFRELYQGKERSREWDLNDPKSVTNDIPARVDDNDPRCGVSSMQRFAGEDLSSYARKKLQQDQMKQWTKQQLDEKNTRMHLQQESARKELARQDELNQRHFLLTQEAELQRKLQTQATHQFNRALAESKREQSIKQKRQDTLDSMEHIRNALDSDFLTENPMACISSMDATKMKPYHMKGISPEQRQAILNEQAAQIEDLKRRRDIELEEEREWDLTAAKITQAQDAMEEAKAERKRLIGSKLSEYRRQQQADAMARQKQLDTRYRNDITDEWWNKFNSVSR